jgi:PadR family transcriptional regulator PadR
MADKQPAELASKHLEENLKKALTEMIMLSLIAEKESFIGEMADLIKTRSGGKLSLVFPYGAIYRLLDAGYIEEVRKRIAPDGRRRQYYGITDSGRVYLRTLRSTCDRFFESMHAVLTPKKEEES